MTSNVGSEYIAKMGVGFANDDNQSDRKQLEEQVNSSLKKEFRPEFLNRIDETVIFNYLGQEEIKEIVDLELDKVSDRLGEKEISIDVTEDAKEFLAEEGFDKNLGARPLKRTIQKEVLNPLSLKIVSGDVEEGDEIEVDKNQEGVIFNGKHLADTEEKQKASV